MTMNIICKHLRVPFYMTVVCLLLTVQENNIILYSLGNGIHLNPQCLANVIVSSIAQVCAVIFC